MHDGFHCTHIHDDDVPDKQIHQFANHLLMEELCDDFLR